MHTFAHPSKQQKASSRQSRSAVPTLQQLDWRPAQEARGGSEVTGGHEAGGGGGVGVEVVTGGGGGGGVARGVVATCAAVGGPLQQTSSFPRAWFIQGCNKTFVILASPLQ